MRNALATAAEPRMCNTGWPAKISKLFLGNWIIDLSIWPLEVGLTANYRHYINFAQSKIHEPKTFWTSSF